MCEEFIDNILRVFKSFGTYLLEEEKMLSKLTLNLRTYTKNELLGCLNYFLTSHNGFIKKINHSDRGILYRISELSSVQRQEMMRKISADVEKEDKNLIHIV